MGRNYYLSSLESILFTPVRECIFEHKVIISPVFKGVIARIEPAVIVDFNIDLNEIIIFNRFEGDTLTPVNSFPCFVHIGILKKPLEEFAFNDDEYSISIKDIETIAWGEIYDTYDDAYNYQNRNK